MDDWWPLIGAWVVFGVVIGTLGAATAWVVARRRPGFRLEDDESPAP